jgi:protein TonB
MLNCYAQETSHTIESIKEINSSDTCNVKKEQDEVKTKLPIKFVEEMPEPIEGWEAMHKFIQDNLKYSVDAKNKGIAGTVFVEFVVEEDGIIIDVRILVGLNPELDEEAIRVVKMLPKWNPGKIRGKPTRCYFNLPVRFTIN